MKSLFYIVSILIFSVSSVRAEKPEELNLQALPIVLKEKTTIADDYIRLGDLFTGLNKTDHEKIVAPAPDLGKEAVLTYDWLKKLVEKNKIDWETTDKKASITVYRNADEISKNDISKAIIKKLNAQGLPQDAELSFQKGKFPVLIPVNSAWLLEPDFAEYNPARQQFEATLTLTVNSEKKQELTFAGKVKVFTLVPAAAKDLKAGQIITVDDILTKRIVQNPNARSANTIKAEDLIGKEVKKSLQSGQIIQANDVREQVMVAKGKIVTLNFTKGGIMLSARGKALENGGLGDTVRVMNSQSKTVVQGTVTGPETVSIQTIGQKP